MTATKTDRQVPFFHYQKLFADEKADFLEIVGDVIDRGAFIMQRDLEEFEENVARYVGAKYCVGVGNATDGLFLAVRAAGIGPGDEVIFSSHTMVATAAPIHLVGGTSVPVDCGDDHLIDPRAVEAAITPRTRAIVPTQLNGRTCDMDALQSLADRHGLVIIEDAAQALGSRYKGRAAGTFGLAGVISFFPAKTLGCLGDGGCVFTNDDQVYEQLLRYRDHGRGSDGEVVDWCLNSRLDNLQAALLDHQLASYDEAITRRREIASLYHEQLGDVKELTLPPPPTDYGNNFDVFQNYEIEAEVRDQLREFLSERGVGTLIQWGGKAVHQFKKLGFVQRLPYTDWLFERLLLLPMNTTLSDDDVHYVCAVIQQFYAERFAHVVNDV